MNEIKIKYFTLEEAQNTLPLVKRIVEDILRTGKRMNVIKNDRTIPIEENTELLKLVQEINEYIAELEEIGCFFKDWSFEIGLVDFPAYINGEEVFLCWRSDETSIDHYHGISEGYAGRKLL